ncbi:nucleotide exchange factor GrpE [Candidatus Saccharibacteria bacterium CG11_big_fil_rev_8_21_14_0_20_41_19]|nr:nucleotide exchange factor GrpE [Candidatus Saccharibacteria bacterium]OIP86061.1 MAG: nucleotide exchange factor GrpE [Candidatus Saccharibacteria bacterium CG2_30_41_52]PIQ70747.1 MAG: nucleotide exchange factor GrpE [Candidatus Saccharibacteria bacterium CG11_big_fil_rev_8_21_14_0_20_41_19]PIZ60344.1 MAG: nucleotide exchange factor GrpE [Candidatus Saccharibacteria bacterium CG_4_10_14_0_2_um_filter_41_11]PJC30018.1 MAG: nucleotide exchange factor GrpE [Candidatus Saccharibacteria bacteri
MVEKKKNKKELEFEQKLGELTDDLQRTRADFENYRKRVDADKAFARESGQASAILKLLPVIDNIERSIAYTPDDLKDNKWVQGVTSLVKNLEKSLESLNLKRIDSNPGTAFNPDLHDAIQMDENATGEHEVIAEEMQAGYTLGGRPIRHAMVKVTRQ